MKRKDKQVKTLKELERQRLFFELASTVVRLCALKGWRMDDLVAESGLQMTQIHAIFCGDPFAITMEEIADLFLAFGMAVHFAAFELASIPKGGK